MVAKRDSIAKVGNRLAELVISGGANSVEAVDIAMNLQKLCGDVGRYEKRYETPEERVLYRHLNLYRNKLAKAHTESERLRWRSKLVAQEEKIQAHKAANLDLDGL